jgi:hypothetical protein
VGDLYSSSGDAAQALKYFSLGLHVDPYNPVLRQRVDDLTATYGKSAVAMCRWRGNIFTQTHEMTTSLGMVHALRNRMKETMIFFHASVSKCVKGEANGTSTGGVEAAGGGGGGGGWSQVVRAASEASWRCGC